jgi:hypothetical protein
MLIEESARKKQSKQQSTIYERLETMNRAMRKNEDELARVINEQAMKDHMNKRTDELLSQGSNTRSEEKCADSTMYARLEWLSNVQVRLLNWIDKHRVHSDILIQLNEYMMRNQCFVAENEQCIDFVGIVKGDFRTIIDLVARVESARKVKYAISNSEMAKAIQLQLKEEESKLLNKVTQTVFRIIKLNSELAKTSI